MILAVLYGRLDILARPSRLHKLEYTDRIFRACWILHNMIADEESYNGTGKNKLKRDQDGNLEDQASSRRDLQRPKNAYDRFEMCLETLDPIKNREQSFKPRESLSEHIWNTQDNTQGWTKSSAGNVDFN